MAIVGLASLSAAMRLWNRVAMIAPRGSIASMISRKVVAGCAMTQVSSKSGRSSRTAVTISLAVALSDPSVSPMNRRTLRASSTNRHTNSVIQSTYASVDVPGSMAVVVRSAVRHDADADGRPVAATKPVLPRSGQGEGKIGVHRIPGFDAAATHRLTGGAIAIGTVRGQPGCPVGEGSRRSLVDRTGPDANQGNLRPEESARRSEEEESVRRVPGSQREARLENASTGDDHHVVPTYPPRHPEDIEDPAGDP